MENNENTLYHYCSCSSFIEIIRNKNIWISAATSLNDYEEINWTIKIIDEVLKELVTEDNRKNIEKLVVLLHHYSPMPFIGSFSKDGDLLSQWRAYSDNGMGVSIGFNPEYFNFKFKTPELAFTIKESIGYFNVEYDPIIQKETVKYVISQYLEKMPDDEQSQVPVLEEAVRKLRGLSYVFKNDAFNEEKECRIIHTPMILGGQDGSDIKIWGSISNMKHSVRDSELISFFEIPFNEEKDVSAIKKIILGPKNKVSKFDMDCFLSFQDFKHIKMVKSRASLR